MTSRRQFLGTLSAPLLHAAQRKPQPANQREEPLNFVFILIDDLGWMDTGFSGSRFYETPALDRLAQRSVRFTNAYAACPVCSPTRAAILTGKYPARLHLTDYIHGEPKPQPYWKVLPPPTAQQLPLEEVTIAEALRQKGYVSAAIGKWHLGGKGFLPQDQGFALNVGGTIRGQPRSYFYPQWGDDPPIVASPGEYLTDSLTDAAIAFLRSQATRPFFLYLAHFGVHIPLEAKQRRLAHFQDKAQPGDGQNNAIYASMIESVDESVGRIVRTLEELGISRRTVLFFTSDNGGESNLWRGMRPTSNTPLRAGKGHLYEGGIRVPLLVDWPGRVTPGSLCDTPVSSIDYFPTLLEMAGMDAAPYGADGMSLTPLLRGQPGFADRPLFWHYPHYVYDESPDCRPGGAMRSGDFKLIEFYEDGHLELYDLRNDLSERNNRAPKQPERTQTMHAQLAAWRKSVNALMPTPNPQYSGQREGG